ncbi:MAG: DUF3592 domain-containing protein [Anaerolineae bacterium]|nr:DUF3592 domain-containing protein [Anaerolineae bacterium]
MFVIIPIGILMTAWQTANLLRTTGVTTEAIVIDRRINEDSDGDTYYVTYEYGVRLPMGDQTRLTHEESVNHDTYQDLPPESRVSVRYSATNPEVVRLEGQSKTFQVILLSCMMLFGGLFVSIGVWFVYSSWREIHKARVLARHGEMTSGSLIDRWTETDSDGDREYCVAFRFAVPGELEITTAEYNRKAYNTLQVGDLVQVRYVPDQPQTCCLEL